MVGLLQRIVKSYCGDDKKSLLLSWQQGMTILLVEQNVRQALTIANRGYVLESGRVVLSGDAHALLRDGLVVQSYLGIKRGSTPDSQGGSK